MHFLSPDQHCHQSTEKNSRDWNSQDRHLTRTNHPLASYFTDQPGTKWLLKEGTLLSDASTLRITAVSAVCIRHWAVDVECGNGESGMEHNSTCSLFSVVVTLSDEGLDQLCAVRLVVFAVFFCKFTVHFYSNDYLAHLACLWAGVTFFFNGCFGDQLFQMFGLIFTKLSA